MPQLTPFLMFSDRLADAVAFYRRVFPEARIEHQGPSASFEIYGQRFNAYEGGPHFRFSEGFSLMLTVETQDEVDRYWAALTADGGKPGRCGWCTDPFGLSWQVVPTALGRCLGAPDREAAGRAIQAMLRMDRLVIAELEAAFRGE